MPSKCNCLDAEEVSPLKLCCISGLYLIAGSSGRLPTILAVRLSYCLFPWFHSDIIMCKSPQTISDSSKTQLHSLPRLLCPSSSWDIQ
jgi:hypothetical protein